MTFFREIRDYGMTLKPNTRSRVIMKTWVLILAILMGNSAAFAGDYVCKNKTRSFIFRQGGSSALYSVRECDSEVKNCAAPVVFERLGFEDQGSFSLHGRRANGAYAMISMIRSNESWTATQSEPYGSSLQSVL